MAVKVAINGFGYFEGRFYDPEHGESDDFPVANRKYYWEIKRAGDDR
mgnify:CR=1 FL=1